MGRIPGAPITGRSNSTRLPPTNLASCSRANATIRNNYIHHNVGNPSSPIPGERGGGYVGQYADNTIVDNNEIAYNGPEQKVGLSANVTFRNNFVHHNLGDGIWYDLNNNAARTHRRQPRRG